jgi:outer membrane protein TolC
MKKTLLVGMVLLLAGGVFAQEAPEAVEPVATITLTVDQAVDYALANSYQIKSGAIDLGIAKRNAKNAAVSTLLPSVQISGTANRSNTYTNPGAMMESLGPLMEAMTGEKVKKHTEVENDHWALVGNVAASWNFSVAMIDQIQAAHLSYAAGQITWEQTLRETELNVRKLFYNLLLLQESLDVQQASLKNARDRMTQAQTNFQNGRIPELSYLQTRVAYENKRPSVLQMEQTLAHSLDTFAFLLGMTGGTKISLDGAITPTFLDLDADTLIAEHLTDRFDYIQLDANLQVLKKQLSAVNHSTYIPVLSINYGLQPSASVAGLVDKDVKPKDKWSDRGSLSFTLAWNLTNMLPFSSNRQQAADLKDNIQKLQISKDMVKESAKTDIRTKVDTLALSRSNITAMEANVDLARSAYNMTVTAYRNGATELLDLRDAEASLIQARLGLANERVNYITGVLDLEYALNTRLQ